MNLNPDAFKKNVPELAGTIDKATDLNGDGNISWDEVAKANSQYQYVVKNEKDEVLETLYSEKTPAELDKNDEGALVLDGKVVSPDMIQEQDYVIKTEQDNNEKDIRVKYYKYTYSVSAGDSLQDVLVEL